MLRTYFLQNWFNLSAPAVEEAHCDSPSMRKFVGINHERGEAPDETTVCKFRLLLEQHGMGRLFEEVDRHLHNHVMKVSTGNTVDTMIVNAPFSTKNQDTVRAPEVHQTKKESQFRRDNCMPGNFRFSGLVTLITLISVCIFAPTSAFAAITPSLDPSRNSGVAPLAVFFDATGTKDSSTSRQFHDLEYTWDFGDAGTDTWKTGAQPGLSKNVATGPVTAHVFEKPGTYTVNLKIFNGTESATASTSITVDDPATVFSGTNTICFSTSENSAAFEGCPDTAKRVTNSNFAMAITKYQGANKRLLFRRGDTFAASTPAKLLVTGPGIIGAFGSGSAPIAQMVGNTTILQLSSQFTPGIKDWRIMDMEFDGLGKPASDGIATFGGFNQVLVLNMNIHSVLRGVLFNDSIVSWHNSFSHREHIMFDEIAIVDSTISPIAGNQMGWRIYASANHLSIIGNALGAINGSAGGSHVIRTPYIGKGVISNNTIARSMINLGIKMHGPTWCDVNSPAGICINPNSCVDQGYNKKYPKICENLQSTYGFATNIHPIGAASTTSGYTEKVVVSDNKIIGAGSPYLVVAGPQNSISDERVRDVIFERNLFMAGDGATQSELVVHGSEITVRNNIFDLSGGRGGVGVEIAPYGGTSPAPVTNNDRVYNNTIYNQDTRSESYGVRIRAGVANATIKNNLAYIPNAKTTSMLLDECGGACYVASNNSSNKQVKNTSPRFYNTPPVLITDWILQTESYAFTVVGMPAPAPVWSDFFRNSRPTSGSVHIGATEHRKSK